MTSTQNTKTRSVGKMRNFGTLNLVAYKVNTKFQMVKHSRANEQHAISQQQKSSKPDTTIKCNTAYMKTFIKETCTKNNNLAPNAVLPSALENTGVLVSP